MPEVFETFRSPGNAYIDMVGPTLASAATIAPVSLITHVSGVASIATITPPFTNAEFTGLLFLVADGAWTWTAGGNIAVAATTVATVNKAYPFLYDKHTAKWYPVVVAAAS